MSGKSGDELKAQGNKLFAAKQYAEAIPLFTEAIPVTPTSSQHILHSNISACHAALKAWQPALDAAEACVKLAPEWVKGYVRKGAALHGLKRWDDAVEVYQAGLKIEPGNESIKTALESVQNAKQNDGDSGLNGLWTDPEMFAKIAKNPKTSAFLADPAFVAKLKALQAGQSGGLELQDPRIIQVMGVLLGIDMSTFERPEGSNEMPPGFNAKDDDDEEEVKAESSKTPSADVEMKPAQPEPTPVPEVSEEKSKAQQHKALGNSAYKSRQFDVAIQEYQAAFELDPNDVTFLTNLSAAQFEKGDYQATIETCEKAVELGREQRADYKLIGKALSREASAYLKLNDLPSAIKYFSKSLTEHRTADTLNKLRDAEKMKKDSDDKAYQNPDIAETERELGNDAFKKLDFPTAVKHYSEAIKRLPSDPRGYANRAATYIKLAAMPEALKDSETAISIDPTFVRAYIRKSMAQFGMREYTKALETIQKAADVDVEKKHVREITDQVSKCTQALYAERAGESDQEVLARAMKDPEVASIMQDPVMNQILSSAQSDPRALQEHMKNPQVASKIQKLINAGVIKTR